MLLVRSLGHYHFSRDKDSPLEKNPDIALTIGNFDGLHAGHRAVLGTLVREARKRNLKAAVMCFEPQPKEFFQKETPARLSRFRDKFQGFRDLGIEIMFCLRFNSELASVPPGDFVFEILRNRMHVRYLVVGDDFRFGRYGLGDYAFLKQKGREAGFETESLKSFERLHDRVSSTLVRKYLEEGRLDLAKVLLGSDYVISGKVCHGQELGRTINFPTANVNLKRRVVPVSGVYAVRAMLPDGIWRNGIANVGIRPTVDGKVPRLEVFILDYSGDLYRQEIRVAFLKKLRAERRFSSLMELKKQIQQDEAVARDFFEGEYRRS